MMIVWYIILGVLLGGIIVGVLFFVRLQKKNMQLLTLQKEFVLLILLSLYVIIMY